jgi:hypothetical protein
MTLVFLFDRSGTDFCKDFIGILCSDLCTAD